MKVELVSWTKNPLMTCAEAASMCYKSEPSLSIIKGCIKSGHHSVLEHASFTFRITDISRSCSHQLVRHRIASYSQESQRYVKMDSPVWVLPTNYMPYNEETQRLENVMIESCEKSLEKYEELSSGYGCTNEEARCVLPNATPTAIVVTMNIRTLINFFNTRLCARAEREIRQVANKMKKSIYDCPELSKEEIDVLDTIFVPQCQRYEIPFCPEYKGCGRYKSLKELVKGDSTNE